MTTCPMSWEHSDQASCECRLQNSDIELGFGVRPGDNLLLGPGRIQSETPGDPLLAWQCPELEEPLPPRLGWLLLFFPACIHFSIRALLPGISFKKASDSMT